MLRISKIFDRYYLLIESYDRCTIDTDYLRNKNHCIDLGVVRFAY